MNFSSWFADLFLIAALCACAGGFFVAGEDRPVAKTVSAALGVILLIFSVRPLAELPEKMRAFSAQIPETSLQQQDAEGLSGVMEAAFCEGILRAVSERFSISAEEISVSTEGFSYSEMKAEKIRILLTGKARRADLRGIRQYVEENYGKCEVEIGYV